MRNATGLIDLYWKTSSIFNRQGIPVPAPDGQYTCEELIFFVISRNFKTTALSLGLS